MDFSLRRKFMEEVGCTQRYFFFSQDACGFLFVNKEDLYCFGIFHMSLVDLTCGIAKCGIAAFIREACSHEEGASVGSSLHLRIR